MISGGGGPMAVVSCFCIVHAISLTDWPLSWQYLPQTEYVIPFDMNTRDTYFLPIDESTGAWIIIISFSPGEDPDKKVLLDIEDTVTDELLDPPRPWKSSTKVILIRNGFATEARYGADIDQ